MVLGISLLPYHVPDFFPKNANTSWEDISCQPILKNNKLTDRGSESITIRAYIHPVVISGNNLCLKNSSKTTIGEIRCTMPDGKMNSYGLSMLQGKRLSVIIAQRYGYHENPLRNRIAF